MELPQPPQDEELKNIIDKLAVFVARNGVEFESMTKQKQRDNPRFAFLFGGEFYNYYMYRVTSEQAILKHRAMREQQQQPGQMQRPNFPNFGGTGPRMQQPQGQNPFDIPAQQMQNFEAPGVFQNQRGPPPGMAQQGGSRFENRGFSEFERAGNNFQGNFPPAGQGGGQDFDQRQQGYERGSNFGARQSAGGPTGVIFDQRMVPGNFDSRQGGDFQAQGFRNIDQRGPGFDQRGPGGPSFEQRGPPTGRFDQRGPPGVGGFDRGPPRDFDQREQRGPGPGSFDRGPPAPGSFEQRAPGRQVDFDQRAPSSRFDSGIGFDQRRPTRFEAPPFEQPRPSSTFETRPQPTPPQAFLDTKFDQSAKLAPAPAFQAGPASASPAATVTAAPTAVTPAPAINVEVLTKQKAALEEQIKQSELNLAAQQQVLLTQQQTQIEEAIRQMQDQEIQQLALELNVDINEFDQILQPIIESCTKDAISSGKAWIFTHTSTSRHYHLVTSFLLRKIMDPASTFNHRLHIIYLVNDVLHHCMRKGAEDLQQVLENMVVPMFCFTKVTEAGNEENLAKLDKLFGLWETKSNYVSPGAVEKLRNYNQTFMEYKNELVTRNGLIVAQIANTIQQTYESYQKQHQLFCQHVIQSIKTLEQQIQQGIIQDQIRLQQQQEQQRLQQQQPQLPSLPGPGPAGLVPGVVPGVIPGGALVTGYPGQGGPSAPSTQLIAPPYVPPNEMGMLDLSKPPPGFPTPPPDKDLVPALPYYELPAGLMVPMVKLEDDNYKPVDPKAMRLPPPCPPTDRLLQAVEAFYAQPSHERPRDSEGWERLGLYEYFKAKNLARKQKEDDIREDRREKSRSPTPIRRDSSPNGGRSPPRRRYQSKSPTPARTTRSRRSRSRSRSPSSSGSSRRKRSRRSRSRSRSPPRRSPTPPSFSTAGLGMERKLDESNKGHQLLKKMGWSGTGLGANEQGIEAPISGGEVRERKDQYKGVGITVNDPFESYRKSKGQAFVERMRARAEERQ